jgi:hypothetical protein
MKVFLSTVSREFKSYRLKLANHLGALKGTPFTIKVQEDFQQGGQSLATRPFGQPTQDRQRTQRAGCPVRGSNAT